MAIVSAKNELGTFLKMSGIAACMRAHGPMFLVASLLRPGFTYTGNTHTHTGRGLNTPLPQELLVCHER